MVHTLVLVLFPVSFVFLFTQIQAAHPAAESLGQVSGRTAVTGSDIQYLGLGTQVFRAVGHGGHRLSAGVEYRGFRGVVQADMDVLSAPDLVIKGVRVL